MRHVREDTVIAFVGLALAGLALLWWIPGDTETGLIVRERRSVQVGDALAPTLAAIGIGGMSLVLLIGSIFAGAEAASVERQAGSGLSRLALPIAIVALSIGLMATAGPMLVGGLSALGLSPAPYRALIATAPWKYVGFALGGTLLVAGLIAWIEARLSLRAVLIALGTVAVLIILYDLPFDTLLLPPNGDQ